MEASGPRCYGFDRFHFDPLRGHLTNGGTPIELRPKSLAVLDYFLAHPQRLITKDELLDAVWGKVVVTEDSLVQCVREIRHALGDADQRLIRTIPRGGYLFVADVEHELPQPPPGQASALPKAALEAPTKRGRLAPVAPAMWLAVGALAAVAAAALLGLATMRAADVPRNAVGAAPAPGTPPLSIVVLPLTSIDGDPAHEYFANGLTSDLSTDLGRMPTGRVISYGSARGYRGGQQDARQIGRELGVRYVLEGTVQRLRDDVRVNLRLVETESGAQRWAERFDGPLADLPRLQADIVRRIAQTLEIRLLEAEAERSARERTRNPDASDLLMRGWALWDRRQPADNAKARELFVQALGADPYFSLAWVGVANTHIADLHAGWSADRRESLRQAEQAIGRAYEIGPRHRDVNAVRGFVLFFQGDVELALEAFNQEIETNAGNPLAHAWRGLILVSLGRPAEAVPSIERAIALSPRDVDLNVFYRSMAHAAFSLGQFGDAVSWSQKSVAHSPKYAKGYAFLAAAAALNGDNATAAGAIDNFRRLQPGWNSVAAFRQGMMPGETRMFDVTPRFWEALQRAGLPAG